MNWQWSSWTAAFVQRMRELGWIKDRPIAIEYRWSEARPERVAEVAAEFVRLKVDVIVSYGTAVPALREATSTIPIVFAIAIDPAGTGIVPSLARPGGNVTGLSIEQTEAAGKRLELLRAVLPHLHRLAVIANGQSPNQARDWRGSDRGPSTWPRTSTTRNPASRRCCNQLRGAQGSGGRTLYCARYAHERQPYANSYLRIGR